MQDQQSAGVWFSKELLPFRDYNNNNDFIFYLNFTLIV